MLIIVLQLSNCNCDLQACTTKSLSTDMQGPSSKSCSQLSQNVERFSPFAGGGRCVRPMVAISSKFLSSAMTCSMVGRLFSSYSQQAFMRAAYCDMPSNVPPGSDAMLSGSSNLCFFSVTATMICIRMKVYEENTLGQNQLAYAYLEPLFTLGSFQGWKGLVTHPCYACVGNKRFFIIHSTIKARVQQMLAPWVT